MNAPIATPTMTVMRSFWSFKTVKGKVAMTAITTVIPTPHAPKRGSAAWNWVT